MTIVSRLEEIERTTEGLREFLSTLQANDIGIEEASQYITECFMSIHLLTEPYFEEWVDMIDEEVTIETAQDSQVSV